MTARPHRVLVTGSRAWGGHAIIYAALDALLAENPDMVVVHGACAQGADALADRWAVRNWVSVERHPAEWRRYGRSAGFRRNADMVALGADVCLAFIRAGSSGATHTADLAEKAGIPVRRWTA